MHIDSAEALADSYGRVAGQVRDAMAELSPLVAGASALLDMPGQHPLYGPMPSLNEAANGLSDDKEDLSWRVNLLRSTDGQPLVIDGRLLAFVPEDLGAAFEQAGLTEEQIEIAEDMMRIGMSFAHATRAAKSSNLEATLDRLRLTELNDEIDNWRGRDNDPILDAKLAERREIKARMAERDRHLDEQLVAFRLQEAESWSTPWTSLETAEYSLTQISNILDTAKHDRGRGIGATVADGIWSTEDLETIIANEHGYYNATQVAHVENVLAMANSSPEARDHLGITQSGSGWTFDDIGHLTLDVLGMAPIVGNAADGINATWYAAQGRYLDAALSSIALIPGLGQLVAPMRNTIRAAASGVVFRSLDEALQWARRWLDDAGILRQADEAAAAGRSSDVGRGIEYDEFGVAVSVDARTLFGPTNTTNNPLLNDIGLQDEMAEAWMDSADLFTPREHGGWIVQNADGTHSSQRWPAGDQSRIGPPQDVPDNVVGAFHTHPNVRGVARPSRADIAAVQSRPELAPHYVVSHDGLFAIDANGSWTTLG